MRHAKTAFRRRAAICAALLLALSTVAPAQERYYYVTVGDPPSGGRNTKPLGSWAAGVGPASKWAFDNQAVAGGNPGAYYIEVEATMDPPFYDRDERWLLSGEDIFFDGYLYDEPSSPTLFWWSCWPAVGAIINLTVSGERAAYLPPWAIATMSTPVYIDRYIDDLPVPDYYDDQLECVDCVLVTIYDSHLTRDEANQGTLNSTSSGAADANCAQAAYNAYDGTNPYWPVSCPWGENALHTYLYDSQGGAATKDVTQINFSGVRRGDVVRYTWWVPGYGPDHVETFSDDGVGEVWGCNTANPIPNWNHASVVAWINDYKSRHPTGRVLVKHYFKSGSPP